MTDKKTILLTGGNTGIGLEACKILCSEGHKVVATVRSSEKGNHCLEEVRRHFSGADIHYMVCDVSNPKDITQFVEEFRAKHLTKGNYLDVLINNAGVASPHGEERTMCNHNSKWEIGVATNCLGPILLSDLLKNDLQAAAREKGGESMIVMLTCSIITYERMVPYLTRLDDLMMEKTRDTFGCKAFKNSKVCLTLASLGLAKELEGSRVAVHLMCPGIVLDTNHMKQFAPDTRSRLTQFIKFLSFIFHPQTVAEGGMHIANIVDQRVGRGTTGRFWVMGKETDLPEQCKDTFKYSHMLNICRNEISTGFYRPN